MQDLYRKKYLKYKQKYLSLRDNYDSLNYKDLNKHKYLSLKNSYGGGKCFEYGLQQHLGECWHDALSMMLFQSDITNRNDEFLNISDGLIHAQYQYLVELFSPENLESNSYKLPTHIYIYYLKNKTNPDINDKITNFLDLSKKYMLGQVQRIQNRLKQDIPRYDADYLLTTMWKGEQSFVEANLNNIAGSEELSKYDGIDKTNLLQGDKTDEEWEAYKRTAPYRKALKNFTGYLRFKFLEREIKANTEESKIPKTEKLTRRLSFRKSIECSNHILNISKLFDIYKGKYDILSHGGNFKVENLAIEILNLYMDNIKYYYTDFISLKDIDNYDALLNMLNNPQLIGIDMGVKFISGGNHAISAYTCGEKQILYDDNLEKPININWKESLIRILTNAIKNNKAVEIPFIENKNVIENINFDEINVKNFDNIKEILKKEIDQTFKDKHLGYIISISPSIKKEVAKSEEEHLLSNIITKIGLFRDELDVVINRLLEIFKIDIKNNNDILNLMKNILDRNIFINLYIYEYLFDQIIKNSGIEYTYSIKTLILHNHPIILKKLNLYNRIFNNIYTQIYLLFLNTADSEIILENLPENQKNFILNILNNNIGSYMIWNGETFIFKPLKTIITEIKLENKTNSLFKQQIIEKIEEIKLQNIQNPNPNQNILFTFFN